ncbi:MAG TPA: hypothetical protein VFI72_16535 [Candidatus Angelobacter sp.]|nr:hypothetical protein [Candidatus Angelobacter sp.]
MMQIFGFREALKPGAWPKSAAPGGAKPPNSGVFLAFDILPAFKGNSFCKLPLAFGLLKPRSRCRCDASSSSFSSASLIPGSPFLSLESVPEALLFVPMGTSLLN